MATFSATNGIYVEVGPEIPTPLAICIPAVKDLQGEQAPFIGGCLFKEFAEENWSCSAKKRPESGVMEAVKKQVLELILTIKLP